MVASLAVGRGVLVPDIDMPLLILVVDAKSSAVPDAACDGEPVVGIRDVSGVIPGPIVAAAVGLLEIDSVPDIE